MKASSVELLHSPQRFRVLLVGMWLAVLGSVLSFAAGMLLVAAAVAVISLLLYAALRVESERVRLVSTLLADCLVFGVEIDSDAGVLELDVLTGSEHFSIDAKEVVSGPSAARVHFGPFPPDDAVAIAEFIAERAGWGGMDLEAELLVPVQDHSPTRCRRLTVYDAAGEVFEITPGS